MDELKVQIGNINHGDKGEYVGRASIWMELPASPLANPFTVRKYGRDNAISAYKTWLWQKITTKDQAVMNELKRLLELAQRPEGVTLLCWCHPKRCHASWIREALHWLQHKETMR